MNDHDQLDTHNIALLNGSVDDALNSAEQAQLGELLTRSEAARKLHAELTSIGELLDSAPQYEPPDYLLNTILSNNRFPVAPSNNDHSAAWIRWPVRRPIRSGFALAATALLLAGIYQIGSQNFNQEDRATIVGTLISESTELHSQLVDSIRIDTQLLQGVVELRRTDDLLTLDLELAPEAPPEFEIIISGPELENGVLKYHSSRSGESVGTTKPSGKVTNSASPDPGRSYQFAFKDTALAGENQRSGLLTLQFLVDGSTVYETQLSTSKQNQ